jgi:hypothetical protein
MVLILITGGHSTKNGERPPTCCFRRLTPLSASERGWG